MASIRVAYLLRNYCKTLEVLVPSVCASAATQLALAADKIIFSSLGYLTPIDAQIVGIKDPALTNFSYTQVSFDSFRRAHDLLEKDGVVKNEEGIAEGAYRSLFKQVHPLVYAEVDRLSTRSKLTAIMMMKMHEESFGSEEKIVSIANQLVYDYPTHGFPILYEEAKKIGLPAEMMSEELSTLLWKLLKYYKSVTRAAITHSRVDFYHVEETPVVIDAFGKRVIKRYSYNRHYFAAQRIWQTLNDNTQWAKLTPSDTPNKPYNMTPIESGETQEYTLLPENNFGKE